MFPRSTRIATGVLLSGILVIAVSAQNPLTTPGGTNGNVPKFTGSTTIANSTISESGGGLVGIARLNNVRFCDQFTGVDAFAQIAACISDLPSTGGIADARGILGLPSGITTPFTVGASSGPVLLLLGVAKYTVGPACAKITMARDSAIVGSSFDQTTIIWPADCEGIVTSAASSATENVRLENLDLQVTGAGFTTAAKALVHLKDCGRCTLRNIIVSHESTTTAAGIRFEAASNNPTFGTWEGILENVTVQRLTANQGTVSNSGQIGIDLLGNASLTNGDVSMFTMKNLHVENQTNGIRGVFATHNTFLGGMLLLNKFNLVLNSSSGSGSSDNHFFGVRFDQCGLSTDPPLTCASGNHVSIDANSSDNLFMGEFESPGAFPGGGASPNIGTRTQNCSSISAPGNVCAWTYESSFLDAGDGFAVRLRASNDSTGFAGIGFRGNTDSSTKSQLYWQASNNSLNFFHNGGFRLVLASNGSVGIGTASPTSTLTVVAGGSTLADAWTTRSSARLKMNVHPLIGALEKVGELQGVSYDWKTNGKHNIGLIAEQVASIVPEVVSFDAQTKEAEGLDYAGLTSLLIEAVKQQEVEIKSLKSRLRRLESHRD